MGQESRQDEDAVGKAGVGSGIPDWLKMQSVSPDVELGVVKCTGMGNPRGLQVWVCTGVGHGSQSKTHDTHGSTHVYLLHFVY